MQKHPEVHPVSKEQMLLFLCALADSKISILDQDQGIK